MGTRMSEMKSCLCILASGILWGTLPLFIKFFAAAGFSPEQTVFTRVLFSAVLLAAWLAFFRPSALRIRLADSWCFAGLKGVAPGKAGVLAAVEPVVATLVGIVVFHEKAGIATLAGMALILGATALLSAKEKV
jgi:drug/metabolite transporter (DMT)-like permease